MLAMARRRYQSPILNTTDEPRWIYVSTMWRQVIGAVWLPPQADLRAALLAALERFRACGWAIETEDPRNGEAFITRGETRLCVTIGGDPWRQPGVGAGDCQSDYLGRTRCPVCKGEASTVAKCPTCVGTGLVKLRNLRQVADDS